MLDDVKSVYKHTLLLGIYNLICQVIVQTIARVDGRAKAGK